MGRAQDHPALYSACDLAPRHALGALCALSAAFALRGTTIDVDLFLLLNRSAHLLPEFVWSVLTIHGHGLVAMLLLAPMLWRQPSHLCAFWLAAPMCALASTSLKQVWNAPRPFALLGPDQMHLIGPALHSASFPSGHAMTAFAWYALALPMLGQPVQRAAALLFAVAVALSRIAVGAHWPADVAGGAAIGLLAGITARAASDLHVRHRLFPGGETHGGTWMAATWLAGGAALTVTDTGYPAANVWKILVALGGSAIALRVLLRRAYGMTEPARQSG